MCDRLKEDRRVVHRVATIDNEWQRVISSGTPNENDTLNFKEWMIVILTMTKTDILLQFMDGTLAKGHITTNNKISVKC